MCWVKEERCVKRLSFCFVLLLFLSFLSFAQIGEAWGEVVTVEFQVAASSDDAEERATGSMSLRSSDLELVHDGGNQTVGIRFNGINIPQGATITNAYIQFKTDETTSVVTFLSIQGEASDNATTFTKSIGDISSRPRTAAAVTWSPVPWTVVGEAGPDQRTPNISSIIQEIVNRLDWLSGNSQAVIFTGTGERVAESYDGGQDGAPLLHVEYNTGPPVNQAPSVDAGADLTITLPVDSVFLDGAVTDDGLPDPPVVMTLWSQVSGPGTVDFVDASAVDTTASFSEAGTYVLQLEADDGELIGRDEITIAVNEVGGNDLPIIIIKADDMRNVNSRWERFVNLIESQQIKASIGIICISLDSDDQEYFDWIKSVNGRGFIEFWNHGLIHQSWESDGITYREFQGTSYEYQRSHIETAQELAEDKLSLTLMTFGAPFNATDGNTAIVLEENPDIKIWLFGPSDMHLNNMMILNRSEVNLEYSGSERKVPDFEKFKADYERNLDLDYIVLQGHPKAWDEHNFEEFESILNYLKGKGSIFMTPFEYFSAYQDG